MTICLDVTNSKLSLIRAMEDKRIKPIDVIENTGVTSFNAVYKWMNLTNKTLPSLETYIQLSDLFDISLDELIIRTEVDD